MGRPPDHTFQPQGRPTAGASEPLGDSVAASFEDGTVRVYGPGGDVRRTWKAGEKAFAALSFSGDGLRLVGGGRDGRVTLADAKDGHEIGSFAAHATRIRGLSVSRDGGVVATSAKSEAAAFRAEGGVRLFTLGSTFAEVSGVAVAPAGDRVAVAFTDVDVRLVDAATGRVALTISDLDMAAFALAFSPDGRLLACGCADGRVSVRDAKTGARVRADESHAEPIGAVGFSPDGAWVTSVGMSMNPATREASVRTTPLQAGSATTESLGVLPHASLGFSKDGTAHVASAGTEGVRVWDVSPPKKA
ncbi:MAG TPA: PQQ-binding-like beta-propeller repeat protein [Thermoanaerobaculia bacterium]|jgi:WD40 repeat protein